MRVMHVCQFYFLPSKGEMVGRLQPGGELGATKLLECSPGEFQVPVALKRENLEVLLEKQLWLSMVPTGRRRSAEQK